jgi:hypothetical protein
MGRFECICILQLIKGLNQLSLVYFVYFRDRKCTLEMSLNFQQYLIVLQSNIVESQKS